jgi:hypothetical protein
MGGVYALNASTGAQIWKATGGSHSSPAVAGGVVYIGDSIQIVAFNASTGTKIWNYTFPPSEYYGISSPAIADGVVYAGNGLALYAFGTPIVTPSPLPPQEPFPTTTPSPLPPQEPFPTTCVAVVIVSVVVGVETSCLLQKCKR